MEMLYQILIMKAELKEFKDFRRYKVLYLDQNKKKQQSCMSVKR